MSVPAPHSYLEVRIEVPRESVDLVCDYIIQHFASGMVLEEEDDSMLSRIIFYVSENLADFETPLRQFLHEHLPSTYPRPVEIKRRHFENVEWLDKYRDSIQAVQIGEDVVVRPGWVPEQHVKYEIVLEPKMAFGTGSHATTRSCLLLIRRLFKPGLRFLDMGCGSGILSILADRMGASYIRAVDYDLAAIENCRENFAINKVAAPHDIISGSIEKVRSDAPYDIVCANIIRSTILTMLPRLLYVTADKGTLILSGLLPQDEFAISKALEEQGQTEFTIMRDEDWLTYTVRKR